MEPELYMERAAMAIFVPVTASTMVSVYMHFDEYQNSGPEVTYTDYFWAN